MLIVYQQSSSSQTKVSRERCPAKQESACIIWEYSYNWSR